MNKEQLILRAKELGVPNIESLTTNKLLEVAIKVAEERLELVSKAEALGIENAKEVESTDLQTLVLAAENTQLTSQLEVLKTVLAIGDDVEISEENVTAALKEIVSATDLSTTEAKKEEPKGKTDKAFKTASGSEYVFTDKAPAAFRYLNVVKTQEDWMQDKDAMELMISGNLSYLTLKRK